MRLTPADACRPPSSEAAVEAVPLVHFMAKVVVVVTLARPDGSMLPKFRAVGAVVTLQVPNIVAVTGSGVEPPANALKEIPTPADITIAEAKIFFLKLLM